MGTTRHELQRDASVMRSLERIADALQRQVNSTQAAIEQRLENDQARRLRETGRCPVCGQDER